MLLLAGPPTTSAARRWDGTVVATARLGVLVAMGSGVVWLLVRTALFEGRPHAALEARAVWRAALDTWPGLVWVGAARSPDRAGEPFSQSAPTSWSDGTGSPPAARRSCWPRWRWSS